MNIIENLSKVGLSIFHIVFVSLLLISLATNLASDKEWLANITYAVVAIMVSFHSYRIYQKLSTD
jgi:hypothetical protein